MSDLKEKFHPALSITNVKSVIPIRLDNETRKYHSWAALFTVQLPILQWIYATISSDLLHAILFKDDSVEAAWKRLEILFRDNKGSRATQLEEELSSVSLANFTSIDAYCNHVKSLADRLSDVDAPVTNARLILKLTGGLPESYSGVVDYIHNQEPPPAFESCRSRLKLCEMAIKNAAAKENGGAAALVATTNGEQSHNNSNSSHGRASHNRDKNKKKNYRGGNEQNNRNRNNHSGNNGDNS
ncbi:uncharacterized protein LOC133824067 [Humulus lupulus]|uniref:uncharacterized protein LOC133824067 n=1 Tax=Humulus lupulus TaxID=3486 RepID=UPI002B40A61A|nr:uncharacterized protein LOC133824067 [Humulus lupulus]